MIDNRTTKLTAEQVRKAMRKYAHDDSCYIFEVYGEMCGAIADEYAKRLEEQVDEMAPDKAADALERFGYVKVVRCRECIYYMQDPDPIDPGWPMMCERTGDDMVEPYGFCAWGERKEGGDD